ncbi:MAG: spore coat U domain-containing protein [Siculibacillus sp.]|nr:spore coat U domain-containing protein [Siculibacillus sp.]
MKKVAAIAVASVLIVMNGKAIAATATGTLGVTLTIAATCTVTGGTMAFGTQGVLTSAINQTATISVVCTNSTNYTVGLDQGTFGSSVTARKMHSTTTGADVDYSLYSDGGRTTNWGNTSGSWVSGTGTGTSQSLTIYGQIPAQTTPAPAADYTDSVTITVTY